MVADALEPTTMASVSVSARALIEETVVVVVLLLLFERKESAAKLEES